MISLIKLIQLFEKMHPKKSSNADLESLLRQARHVLTAKSDAENQL